MSLAAPSAQALLGHKPQALLGLRPQALLGLMRLASPALPVGGYSYSEGLEAAVDTCRVSDEASAQRWLIDQLALSLARSDLPLLAAAWRAWTAADTARAAALNDWILCTRESGEARQQTLQMGRSLAEWLRQQHGGDARMPPLLALKPAPSWPLAFALACVLADAPLQASLLGFAFGWAENMVQAAVKSVPLGQSAGQRVLGALVAELPGHVERAMAMSDEQRQCFTPMLAILSAQHETQYSRLFRS